MESTAPSHVPTTIVPQNNPKGRGRYNDVSRGFFYYFAFLSALASVILAVIAITRDELTEVDFRQDDGTHLIEYCGWSNVHFDNSDVSYMEEFYQHSYSKYCPEYDRACDLDEAGKGWYSLLIIAIVFEGLAVIGFVFDFAHPSTYIGVLILDFLAFLCLLAAVLTWGIGNHCDVACNSLDFPYSGPNNGVSCEAKFATSWILAVISGGMALLAFISLILSRLMGGSNKRY